MFLNHANTRQNKPNYEQNVCAVDCRGNQRNLDVILGGGSGGGGPLGSRGRVAVLDGRDPRGGGSSGGGPVEHCTLGDDGIAAGDLNDAGTAGGAYGRFGLV